MQKLKWASACLLSLMASAPTYAASSSEDDISYIVKRGDTLTGLAERYLIDTNSYKIVQRKNRIANVYALPVGKTILVPRALLKFVPAKAKVISVRGNVLADDKPVAAGQVLGEGTRLTTSASSFVTLSLGNGSRVSLPSNSGLRIRTLRTYVLGDNLDYDFDLAKGGAQSNVVPLKSANDRYRVRTPKAVSAVRGTEFQARYDPDSNADFAEVIEGGLAVDTAGGAQLPLPAGNGLAVPANGVAITETLLAEPALVEPGLLQANPAVLFSANRAPNELGYRFTLSSDAGFVDQIADKIVTEPKVDFGSIANGNYFVRARAISANGIQGIPATYTFKRRLNGMSASAGQGDDGYAFKWQSDGEGVRKFHFQLFKDQPNGLPIADEPAMTAEQISLSDLLPGTYFWRVGSVQYLDGEVATNWTGFEKLSVTP
jgi:hypothetical protein